MHFVAGVWKATNTHVHFTYQQLCHAGLQRAQQVAFHRVDVDLELRFQRGVKLRELGHVHRNHWLVLHAQLLHTRFPFRDSLFFCRLPGGFRTRFFLGQTAFLCLFLLYAFCCCFVFFF